VLVAPDKFAGSLTAREAAAAIGDGWLRARPDDDLDLCPLSDGGPGFLDVLAAADPAGRLVRVAVAGPLGEEVAGSLLVVEDSEGRRRAYDESDQACGLALEVSTSPSTELEASTAGVDDLLLAALAAGAAEVVVGVGGTASTDGGRGCLERIGGAQAWPSDVRLRIATDVSAPLLGPLGAAAVFGPQKGATPETVEALETRLEAWARETEGRADEPGSGAGGGLAYGLRLLGGELVPGVRTVTDAVGLVDRVSAARLVLTGEGRFDASSLMGKVPAGVAALARTAGVPCLVLAGDRDDVRDADLERAGISGVRTLAEAFGRESALRDPVVRLADLAAALGAAEA
jgi:glycerate kinase